MATNYFSEDPVEDLGDHLPMKLCLSRFNYFHSGQNCEHKDQKTEIICRPIFDFQPQILIPEEKYQNIISGAEAKERKMTPKKNNKK